MENIQQFNVILNNFNIKAFCVDYQNVDNYFYYDLKLNPNAKVKEIQKYTDEISLALKTFAKPSIKILHNLGVVRLEFAQLRDKPLNLFDIFTNDNLPKGDLLCLLGQGVSGQKIWMDLSQNPHMIVSGTTGSGKSILLHNIIANVINYSSGKLYLLDPKNIEFAEYERKIKRNLQVGYTYEDALGLLDSLLNTMEDRYEMIRSGFDVLKLPYLILIVDEFSDLILQDKNNNFYNKLCALSQKCRAARICIILSTQRPSVNVINGTIKANFPARISCKVASHVDSKVILDAVGAENLLGKGDALIRDNFRLLERFQIAYTSAEEVCKYFGDECLT